MEGYVLQSASLSQGGNALTFDEDAKMVFSFSVAYGYRSYALPYRVDAAQAKAAAAAVENANTIVEQYSTCSSDYEKLLAYKEEICALTGYNTAAAENSAVPYGDPWQLVYVFDGREDTTVVCEGYAKAFQYLCDRTVWEDAACYTVSGTLSSAASEGPPHVERGLPGGGQLPGGRDQQRHRLGGGGRVPVPGRRRGQPGGGLHPGSERKTPSATPTTRTPRTCSGPGCSPWPAQAMTRSWRDRPGRTPYTDVARTDWYYGAVRYAMRRA